MSDDFTRHTDIKWTGNVGVVEYGGGDRSMVVMFYNKPIHNPAKSKDAGRPIYDDVVMVRIHPPGERLNIVDRPAEPQHKQRYPGQWQAFLQNKRQVPEGTPIDMLYPEHPSIAAGLRASGIHTIEQCAELSANAIENIGMGGQRYVNDAVRYLSAANKGVKATQFRKELEDRDQQIKLLTRTVEQLKAKIDDITSRGTNNGSLADQLQALLAHQQARPTHQQATHFDPAMEQINATHGSTTQSHRPRVRSRSRLAG